ncbi:TonB-dependent receptor plug domain-containing protein [Luteimonas sp. 22616]|uniref:TonB-dependent receptor plug domain-containing protein n=1 Tax=Luteimonas sp. 22616 TaxID=3453951 RepID=UPI003F842F36
MHHRKTRITAAGHLSCKALALAVAIVACLPVHVAAAEPDTAPDAVVDFDIPAGDLSLALERFSTQSGIQAMYRQELVAGKRAPAVKGALAPAAALAKLLAGAGLASERVNARTYVLKAAAKAKPASEKPAQQPKSNSPAREDTERNEVHDLADVVVVGSRLGSSPVESAMPIKVITRDEIDRTGAGNIMQVLSYLPEVPINNDEDQQMIGMGGITTGGNTNSTTVQMRGMPRGTTLVLINGRRTGESPAFSSSGLFDLSTIPLSLVERIEVLPAGASAVYGGDALAGVINIVLRKDASGLELRVRRDVAEGYGTSQASAMWGKSWAKGAMTATATWSDKGALYNHERALTADSDFRRFGGADLRNLSGFPATVYSLDGCPASQLSCVVPLDQRNPLPGLESPVAVVPEGSNGIGLKPEDFLATQGMTSKQTNRRHLRSPEENYGLHVNGHLELSSSVEAFAEWTHTRRKVPAYQAQFVLFGGERGPAQSLVPADHPFNPFGVPVGVNFFYKETGIFTSFEQQHQRALLGLRGTLGRFYWEVSGFRARDEARSAGGRAFDANKIAAALASKDPATTINPFVSDGSAPASPEVLRSLLATGLSNDMGSRTSGLNGYVRGPVFNLPAGQVTALLGGEIQTNRLELDTNDQAQISPHLQGSSTNRAAFAEVRVPVLSPRKGQAFERVAMTGALRRETSDRYSGNALTKTIGLEVRPWESLLLRSTYSTGFRPITVYSVSQDPRTFQNAAVDPKFPNEVARFEMLVSGGVAPDLVPETSRTITMGATFRPSEDWSISMTHWSIKFVDQISSLSPQALIENEHLYPHRVRRNPETGRVEFIDSRPINIALRDTAGIDVGIDGFWSTELGDFYPALAATFTYSYEQQLTSQAPVVSNLALYDPAGWAPRWKIVPRLGWEYRDTASAMLVGRYVNRYRDASPLRTGPDAGKYQDLGEFWIFDLNINLNLGRIFPQRSSLSGSSLTIGANNILNRLPDFCAGCGVSGYDASQYDILGRKLYAEIKMSF